MSVLGEILALEEERGVERLRQGVGEAVAEVELRRMAALAEGEDAPGRARSRLARRDRNRAPGPSCATKRSTCSGGRRRPGRRRARPSARPARRPTEGCRASSIAASKALGVHGSRRKMATSAEVSTTISRNDPRRCSRGSRRPSAPGSGAEGARRRPALRAGRPRSTRPFFAGSRARRSSAAFLTASVIVSPVRAASSRTRRSASGSLIRTAMARSSISRRPEYIRPPPRVVSRIPLRAPAARCPAARNPPASRSGPRPRRPAPAPRRCRGPIPVTPSTRPPSARRRPSASRVPAWKTSTPSSASAASTPRISEPRAKAPG